jgi:hypothetical protein
MRREVSDRFPAEITPAALDKFERAMQNGLIVDNELRTCDKDSARKYRDTLLRGLYICIKISEVETPSSPYKIAASAKALDVIKERIEQGMRPASARDGRAIGDFFAYCTSHPTPEKPYAHLPPKENNPSAVTDWLQAFARWKAAHSQ